MKFRALAATALILFFLSGSVVPAAAATPYWASESYKNWVSNWYQQIYGAKPKPAPAPTPAPAPAPAPTAPAPAPAPAPTALTALEQQMVDLVNKERTSRGLKALQMDARLVKVARLKSTDMIQNNYFGHISPVYGSPFDMMKAQGITYRKAGENLAGAGTVEQAHTGLMNSTGHRANILDPVYTHIGIGIVKGGQYGYMFSQEFIGL